MKNRPSPAGKNRPSPAGKNRPSPGGIDPARSAALQTLAAVRERGAYANLVLPGLLRDARLTGRDAAFATELTYGTCRAQGLLDAVIEDASGRSTADIDGPVLDALRLGVYQLLRTRVGAHAAVSETVDSVKETSGRGASGFANAVLRKVSRDDEDTWVAWVAAGQVHGVRRQPSGLTLDDQRQLVGGDLARPRDEVHRRPGVVGGEQGL